MILFYIRHGDPTYDPDALTPLGRRQAEALAKRLAVYGVDRIYTSSSMRARETAQPLCEMLKRKATILDWCNEHYAWQDFSAPNDHGGYDWMFVSPPYRKLFVSPAVRDLGQKWYTHPAFKDTHAASGVKRIAENADALLLELGYEHDRENCVYRAVRPNNDRVAIFAHEGFGMALLSSILDIPYPMFCSHMAMSHSGMTVIDFSDQGGNFIPRIFQFSSDSHLYREGLPLLFQNCYRF